MKTCVSIRSGMRSVSSDSQTVARWNFLCGSQLALFADLLQLHVDLDRVVAARRHGDRGRGRQQ